MDTTEMMTTPTTNGDKPLPKRSATRTMVPLSWLRHELKIEYVDADGQGVRTRATLLDFCPVGLLLNIAGSKCLLAWDRLVLAELVAD
jgi:hypothetical protein